ncbi:hypothetical protein MKW98_031960 [Papaver atlanticum]|uniref:Uncharacterized protein n=1 Tax=Papaver atlanticum TaxID=357466 RepID=A0AAD4SE65_9MAGN|nr:hypothetical protein MKW98_031960 [Papaver atlanticum]
MIELLLEIEVRVHGGGVVWMLATSSYLEEFLVYPTLTNKTGWRTYRRPDAKSGGHGVGWSPIIPYTFSVPQGWEEVPVSIADLGGTEIDLRFASSQAGHLFVIVAPVLSFLNNIPYQKQMDLQKDGENKRYRSNNQLSASRIV